MSAVVRRALGDRVQLTAKAPAPLQVELRKQVNRLNVHIVNNCADGQYPFSAILSAGRVELSVLADRPVRIRSTRGRDVDFAYAAGRVELGIVADEQYEILSFEYE